jgi:CRP-like cAMP-binding protein
LSLTHDTIVDLLDGLDLFTSLSSEEVDSLARRVEVVTWEAGTLVFAEGDRGDSCYVIHRGQVKLTRRLADGQPIALAQVGQGAIVGELALFAPGGRSASMQVLEETEAVAISREDLMAILLGNAQAAVSMAVHVAGLLQKAEDRLFATSTSTVNGRILAALLAQVEARQALHPGERDVELVGSPTDLARLAGAPKDAATRLLHWLENEGVISLKRGRIIVRSPAGLRGHLS